MKKLYLPIAILLAAVWAAPVQGLSCLPAPPPEQDFAEAQAVFVGFVTKAENTETFDMEAKNLAHFQVSKVYKGQVPAQLVVETDGGWGMQFQAGLEYLVYLDSLDPYAVALCKFGTMELPLAAERIAQIEAMGVEPTAPEPLPSAIASTNQVAYWEYVGAVGLLIGAYFTLRFLNKKSLP